jgi:ornithine cyclodeaminase
METLILTRDDLANLVGHVGVHPLMDEVIKALRQTFLEFDEAVTEVRQRDGFAYVVPNPGVLEWMPMMQVGELAVVKMVGYNPLSPRLYDVPTIVSTISLYDIATAHLVALIDGTFATALRTGAASAVATEVLAHPSSEVVGLVGCGAQAVTQLHALSRLFEIRKVLVHDTDAAVARSFLDRAGFLGLDVEVAERSRLEEESDIICTATSVGIGEPPVIEGERLKPWIHINAVGSDLPQKIELPLALLKRSLVCPDHLAQAVVEGECQRLSPGEIGPTLIELVKEAERYAPHRTSPTVFDSTGFALEDKAVLQVLLAFARELGLGRSVPVETIAADPTDPYSFVRVGRPGLMPETAEVGASAPAGMARLHIG